MGEALRARVLRGSTEVGGSCVELSYGAATILIDAGAPLSGEEPVLPQAVGIGESGPLPLAVLVSHGHQGHWGLVPTLPSTIPVWIGRGAADILRAADFWGSGIDLREAGHYRDREPFRVGPFTVTPYLTDHSGFAAYSLHIEAGGRSLFYTGDFRGHGRKHSLQHLLAHPPRDVHALVIEGASLRLAVIDGDDAQTAVDSETAVEHALTETLRETDGMVVVLSSPQNIDRAVTAYRAALRAGRDVAVDLYSADVLEATGRPTIPSRACRLAADAGIRPPPPTREGEGRRTVRPSRGSQGTACIRRRPRGREGPMDAARVISARDPTPDPQRSTPRRSGCVVDVGRVPRQAEWCTAAAPPRRSRYSADPSPYLRARENR
ncbi:MBL fold metallo-hydrolase [Microbacterium sp.]|uniref:MBL fold metallo-hydrolase n=1 Tax=Microbacterium sp. TaxID=51671 RepID=UPI003C769ACB